MGGVLIVHGTAYGQTERLAQEIARVRRKAGHDASVARGDRLPPDLAVDDYDGFVIASSVLLGRHHRYVGRFVRDHVTRLNAAPSAFASVCGVVGGSNPDGARVACTYVDRFLAATAWKPGLAESFAGALAYSRTVPGGVMMKLISRRTGGRPTRPAITSSPTGAPWPRFAGMLPADRPAVCSIV